MSEKWYEFNDNIVRDFSIGDLANECFGGEETFGEGSMSSHAAVLAALKT